MSGYKNVFTFPAGLPGLPSELTRFELVALAKDSPFFFLQSLQDDKIGFILANPFDLFPDYEFDLPEEDAAALDIKKPGDAAAFCIVNAARGFKNATVNLLAPLVLNTAAGTARQVVLDDRRYSVRHPLPRPATQSSGHAPGPACAGPETLTGQQKADYLSTHTPAPAGNRAQTVSPAAPGEAAIPETPPAAASAGQKGPAGEGN